MRRWGSAGALWAALLAVGGLGLGSSCLPPQPGGSREGEPPPGTDASVPSPDAGTDADAGVDGGADAGTPPEDGGVVTPAVRFQPGHHLALRDTVRVEGRTTFRLRLPLQRGGSRVRLHLRSGTGALQVARVFVATRAQPTPVPVYFSGGAEGVSLPAQGHVVSEPVALPVAEGEDLVVTLEAQGALAASRLPHLPGGERREGAWGTRAGGFGGEDWRRAVGVSTVDVEAPATPVVLALGDSITEGYVDGTDDARHAWPHLASERLGWPVLNAGVSSQGLVQLSENLEEEALVLEGVTDCVVLIGTNDLASTPVATLTARFERLYARLTPFCRVWAVTLLPKERTSVGSLSQVLERRGLVNRWLRSEEPEVQGVLDFDAVLRAEAGSHDFAEGMDSDGIHPSNAGQRKLGEAAARFLSGAGLTPPAD